MADVSACTRRVTGAIPATFRWAIRAMAGVRTVSVLGARRDDIAMEVAGTSAGRHCRPSMIHRSPLGAIRSRCMFVLDLLSPGLEVMLVFRNPLALTLTYLNSVRPTVEADVILVVHH